MSSEEPEYDVFVNKKVQNIQFKLDANNAPVIMAEVGMYYTTKKSNAWGYKDTSYRNTETILLTRKTGTWSRHSFRNLQGGWSNQSILLRNNKGELQPLIFDRHNTSLYAPEGDNWKLKKKLPVNSFSYSNVLPYNSSILLVGTDSWQTVFNSYEGDYFNPSKRKLKVIRTDFTPITLDSNLTFDGRLLFSSQDANFVIGMIQTMDQYTPGATSPPFDTSQYMDFLVYSWSHNPLDPKPNKQILKLPKLANISPYINKAYVADIKGEPRVFVETYEDSIIELSIKGRDLVFIGKTPKTLNSNLDLEPPMGKPNSNFGEYFSEKTIIDQSGCVHGIRRIISNPIRPDSIPFIGEIGLAHKSTCSERVDTLVYPPFKQNGRWAIEITDLSISSNGSAMLALTLENHDDVFLNGNVKSYSNSITEPRWVYFASLPVAGKWQLEKVAEY